ncbi:glycosyltransferase family 2 protein [Cysteiniphilum halobium]|uniref:glycosyltransferase family 2 protein n=1 Tax=Cysteiniphilum halobium TaxID=2219059 RepID=UPI000E64E69E|nr:glycosyltransferase family 2 protein [Cysteiniphilum halobium]
MNKILFTIVIPTFNRLNFLKRALNSALDQTYENIEIIVLNNASTDGTKQYLNEIASKYKQIKVVHHAMNIGFTKNIQQIKNYVHGKYMSVLSDDDYLTPEFVETAVCVLENDSTLALWYCRANYVNHKEELLYRTKKSPSYEEGYSFIKGWLKGKRFPTWVSVAIKTDVLVKVDWFSCYGLAIDMATILRCAVHGRVAYTEEVLCYYTIDTHNLTTKTKEIDWFNDRFKMQQYFLQYRDMSVRLWVAMHIRSLLFGAYKINFEQFKKIFRQIFKISKGYSILYLLRYAPHFLVRTILGRGKLFQFIRRIRH